MLRDKYFNILTIKMYAKIYISTYAKQRYPVTACKLPIGLGELGYCTLYTVQYIRVLYTVHCTLYTVQYIPNVIHR